MKTFFLISNVVAAAAEGLRWTATAGRRRGASVSPNAPGGRVPPRAGRFAAGLAGMILMSASLGHAAEEATSATRASAPTAVNAARVAEYYAVTKVPTPTGVDPQIGGLATTRDGRLVACFHHGEVAFFDPKAGTWKIFAEGLHEPLGLLVEDDGSVLVMQRPELTRLRDTNGDGVADSYETVWDGFGMTGNYHEFAFGPVRGPNGKLYVSLNLASNGATVREEIRGAWIDIGLPREKFYSGEWRGENAEAAGRMYSRVPYRGCVVELDPKTGAATPFAYGFRSPDGMGFDAAGNLYVNDNQGDWRGTSPVHVVQRDGFYGHPASLVWRKGWGEGDPLQLPVEKLEALRTKPAIQIPYGSYGNSPTQMLMIPETPAWGPFGGQMIVGEMNTPRIFRMLPEQVDGTWQGALVLLAATDALKGGLHRFAWLGDTLYVGRTHLSWAGGEGMSAVRPTGKVPFDPVSMRVTPRGYRFEFPTALAASAADPALWTGNRYYYKYHAPYGSPEMDKTAFTASKVTLSDDNRTVDVELADLKPGYLYDFDLAKVTSAKGETPLNPRIVYTLNKVPGK